MIEPRKSKDVEADAVPNAEGNIMVASGTIQHDSTGVGEHGMQAVGSHQEPGRSCHLRLQDRIGGKPESKPLAQGG